MGQCLNSSPPSFTLEVYQQRKPRVRRPILKRIWVTIGGKEEGGKPDELSLFICENVPGHRSQAHDMLEKHFPPLGVRKMTRKPKKSQQETFIYYWKDYTVATNLENRFWIENLENLSSLINNIEDGDDGKEMIPKMIRMHFEVYWQPEDVAPETGEDIPAEDVYDKPFALQVFLVKTDGTISNTKTDAVGNERVEYLFDAAIDDKFAYQLLGSRYYSKVVPYFGRMIQATVDVPSNVLQLLQQGDEQNNVTPICLVVIIDTGNTFVTTENLHIECLGEIRYSQKRKKLNNF